VDTERDAPIHRSLAHLNENPVFLLFDPRRETKASAETTTTTTRSSLPVTLYESCTGVNSGFAFRETAFVVETVEAERVSVDHVARASDEEKGAAGALAAHAHGLGSAVRMLETRLAAIVQYLKEVEGGHQPPDRAILRAAAAAAAAAERMRAAHAPPPPSGGESTRRGNVDSAFERDFAREMGDADAAQYLGLVTKAAADFEQFARRHAAVHDGGGRRF
jgi:COP9 signalosome complex subunit 6